MLQTRLQPISLTLKNFDQKIIDLFHSQQDMEGLIGNLQVQPHVLPLAEIQQHLGQFQAQWLLQMHQEIFPIWKQQALQELQQEGLLSKHFLKEHIPQLP